MKIHVGGKVYSVDKFTPRIVIEADRILDDALKDKLGGEPEHIEEMAAFIARLFGNKFTADEFLDGFESAYINSDLLKIFNRIRGIVADAIGEFPEPAESKNAQRGSEAAP